MPSYDFDDFTGVTLNSQPKPLSGQKNRSSKNYYMNKLKRYDKMKWVCPKNISFNVMEDKSVHIDPVIFSGIKNGTTTGFPTSSECHSLYIANPSNASQPFDVTVFSRKNEKEHDSWMRDIDDERMISDLCIPGTHDSGATWGVSYTGRCQTLSIFDQLYTKGVRFLDIRCKKENNRLRICHGFIRQSLYLEDVLAQCILFLRIRPTETIIMSVKKDDSGDSAEFEKLFWDQYYYSSKYFHLWSDTNQIPKIGKVRGKIVLFRRFSSSINLGIDASPSLWQDNKEFEITGSNKIIAVQDRYSVRSGAEKFDTYVKPFLDKSSADKWYINFASAYVPPIPNAADVSNVVNVKLDEYLATHKFKGVLMMDYIDQNSSGDHLSVTRHIIDKN